MNLEYEMVETVTRYKDRWNGYSELLKSFKFAEQDSNYYPTLKNLVDRSLLHFWTFSAFFALSRQSMSDGVFRSSLESSLFRFGLQDFQGDWCGTIILDETWFNRVGETFEFIAISEASGFELEEFDSWNYYVPHGHAEGEWYVYYALLVETRDGIASRVGLAKIFKAAFQTGSCKPGMTWKEIVLG